MSERDDRIEIENAVSPGHRQRVDRAKYTAMRDALLAVLPAAPPGLSVAEAKDALLPGLPEALFPGGAKAGWWLKAVQLDLEAKGTIERAPGKPVRLFKRPPR
ncbi:hypothetical protein SAMN04487939_10643 [Lysobacter sp. yr284]|uniref:DUF6958 family protein n=1 Tax=Lysobacter sp. yr284 TaxID=1761791 RepID=UPI000898E341|nr:hypothetical protein [Lysobacter sp. yr284]SDY77997.1 hypothetical protein SAMN04487939_10643 [Lysobacter sp. yr284]